MNQKISFYRDVEYSSRRAARYWNAIKQKAFKVYGFGKNHPASPTLKSISWSALIFQPAVAKAIQEEYSNPLIDIDNEENNSFQGIHLIRKTSFVDLCLQSTGNEFEYIFGIDASYVTLIEQALELIISHWPDAHNEVFSLIRGIARIRSSSIDNFSDPKLFGLIHLRIDQDKDPLDYAIDLIHEAAHHALFIESATDQILRDPSQRLYSAIRKSYRPAIGVYHGAVATGRMLEFLRRIRSQSINRDERVASIVTKLIQDQALHLEQLSEIKMTTTGRICFLEMEQDLLMAKRAESE